MILWNLMTNKYYNAIPKDRIKDEIIASYFNKFSHCINRSQNSIIK